MIYKFSCIIIDDEPMAIELLSDSLNELYGNIDIIGTYTSWKPALVALREGNFDLVFIDIAMPEKSGIDLLNLVADLSCEIIFITAHADYALHAFSYPAAGYILKPVKDANLTKIVDKVIERLHHKKMAGKISKSAGQEMAVKIGIPYDKGIEYLSANDIIYVEAINRYAKVVTEGSQILSSYNIGKFKNLIEGHIFYQVHRSYIINSLHMRRYENTGIIVMTDGKEIPVSKHLKQKFLNSFGTINRQKKEE